jgi:prolyl 4-hydroxylase
MMHEWDKPQGPRILTVFLYLNDVQGGGGTHFGRLSLTVMPKKGRALIWPSVLDEDPLEWDERTHHEALEVTAGVKYGANAWLHLRDYKTQHDKNCV